MYSCVKGEISAQLLGFPCGARHRRRFSVLCSKIEINTAQLLPKVPTAQSSSPEVSEDQVNVQSIEALRAGPLHNNLVTERPKTVLELYE
jgi:hypothetical protein